jgi:hypothetical protein
VTVAPSPAERRVADALASLDEARARMDGFRDAQLAAIDRGDVGGAWSAYRTAGLVSVEVDTARAEYDAAFDALAQERSSASPVALVPRALTPDEASLLAVREHSLARTRRELDSAVRFLWASQQLCLDAGNAASAEEWRLYSRDMAEGVADLTAHVSIDLDARAPLLAAQWEAAS